MNDTNYNFRKFGGNSAAFCLLFFLIFTIYSNTFNASWHFDDAGNIVENPHLHIKDLSFESLRGTFYSSIDDGRYEGKNLYRPIASLSFALNWYWGKDNVTGYHVVNILIHFLTAFFLYLTIIHLFSSPRLKDKFNGNEHFIALLSSVLWAVNPIQIQAVTFIVQRMASLCAMFYVMSLYFYIRGRNEIEFLKRVAFFAACLGAFMLAIGSKENAAVLPIAVCLVEIIFYKDFSIRIERRRIVCITFVSVIVLLGLSFYMLRGDFFSFLNGYERRPFSLAERLLTEPRIILFYVSQICYPLANRFSLDHDIIISKSVFEPITTVIALFVILTVIGISLFSIRKKPVIAFGILFFFLNHIVESTILPLELIFEHRNYLPSLFIFFPVSMGLNWLINKYHKDNRIMVFVVAGFATVFIAASGLATYTRNFDWLNDKTLWEDAMIKAPQNERPPYNLAMEYYKKIGNQDKVLELLTKSLNLRSYTSKIYKDTTLVNMANVYMEKKQYEKAAELFKKSLQINPDNENARYNLILKYVLTHQLEMALRESTALVEKNSSNLSYMMIHGYVLLKMNRFQDALSYFSKIIARDPENPTALLYTGIALSGIERYRAAGHFLARAHKLLPSDIEIYFSLIENSIKSGNHDSLNHYLNLLAAQFSIDTIMKKLSELSNDGSMVPVSKKLIMLVVADKIMEKSKQIRKIF